ncbi:condensation domain-containing protein [Azorhizophilus paspali]|uniref:Condensation domain-containing protein n=1 Tax=Azorhizophilus paspali TaxID=69963 RepID=A0ABV6SG95_AZOPA
MNATPSRLPATTAQFSIWVAQQAVPDSPAYLTAETIELLGTVDRAALSDTVVEVLNNCHSLHMRFVHEEGRLWQLPQPPACPPLALHDFRREPDPAAAAQAWIDRELSRTLDLGRDVLYRSALLQLGDQRHLWYLQAHHVTLDGYAYGLVCQTIAERYSARVRQSELPPLPDWSMERVVQAERDYRAKGLFERDKQFWLQHLRDVPAPATIAEAAEFPEQVIRSETRLQRDQVAMLQEAARACGQDWGNWVLAAIGLWLGRQSGQQALTFALPAMNRLGTPALGVPCMAMNIVPLSLRIDPASSMASHAQQIAGEMRRIRPHLYYRYGWMRMDLDLMEAQKHLFNQAVNLMPFDRKAAFAGLESRIRPITAGPVKDLNVTLAVLDAEWRLCVEANPHAYSSDRLDQLHGDLLDWLQRLARHAPQAPLQALWQ